MANIDSVVGEFLEARNLTPLRLVLVGPPAVGKSVAAGWLAEQYGLQVLDAKALLAAVDDLGAAFKQVGPCFESYRSRL